MTVCTNLTMHYVTEEKRHNRMDDSLNLHSGDST